jgi:DNA-binding NarL/FixJ family response regulator
MKALEIAYTFFLRGNDVAGSGWISRAQRLLEGRDEGIEHGYLAYIAFEGALGGPDPDAVAVAAREIQAFGRRHDDPNLLTLGTAGEGRALLRMGRVAEGLALLDEAALALGDDRLDPEWAGNLYCHLVAACYELGDVRRASAWTDALAAWCEQLAPAAVFTGICRVHRAQLFQLEGAWERAAAEATKVCDELVDVHTETVAEGWYARGDLARLRGDLDDAREAYDRARDLGRDPQPGVALLRLAEGHVADAFATIRAGIAVTDGRLARTRLLPAAVTIAIAHRDVAAAEEACAELERAAADFGSSGLTASAAHARGAVALADGDPAAALRSLLDARRAWHDVHAPHDGACARVLLAAAYRALGDERSARAELEAAVATFAELGAAPDAARVGTLLGEASLPARLTAREAEVLRHVATGGTNRDVARALFISEKTVARHLSNVFAKTGVASRTEAAAYAFSHGLADPADPRAPRG